MNSASSVPVGILGKKLCWSGESGFRLLVPENEGKVDFILDAEAGARGKHGVVVPVVCHAVDVGGPEV